MIQAANIGRWYWPLYFKNLTHFWDKVNIIYLVIIHFSDYCSKSGLFLRIYNLFFCFRLKHVLNICSDFRELNHCWAFQVYFDFQNFHLTTQLRRPHCYSLLLVYMTLDSKFAKKKISTSCMKKQRPQVITNQTDHRWTTGTLERPWNI